MDTTNAIESLLHDFMVIGNDDKANGVVLKGVYRVEGDGEVKYEWKDNIDSAYKFYYSRETKII